MKQETCVLCGQQGPEVAFGLIAWREPIGRDVFTAAPRCRDKLACRGRVEALGESWDVMQNPVSTRELIEGQR